jgi:hypothetical protein
MDIDPEETLEQIVKFLFTAWVHDGDHAAVFMAPVEDGYFYLWADGNTHHSYHHPEALGYREMTEEDLDTLDLDKL